MLLKGKMLKSSIKTLQTLDKNILSIAVNSEGEIIFIEMDNNDVSILTLSGEKKTVLNTFPMRPRTLHVNKNNELIVGLKEVGPSFPVTDFSIRQVIFFYRDYKTKVILQNDKKGKKLFSYPGLIKTDSRNTLYVFDAMDETIQTGRIVAVDVQGRLIFTYNGNPDYEVFIPSGIAITPSDNVIISDYSNNALHVLNDRGEPLGLVNIERPCSLCINVEGNVLIGTCPVVDNVDSNAKIYVTKIDEYFL